MRYKYTSFFAAVACFPFGTGAFADKASLYAEPAPDDASFVRFIGFEGEEHVQFAGYNFTLKEGEATAYIPISTVHLTNVLAGGFVTVLRGDAEQPKVIVEGPRNSRSKVLIILVNGTDRVLDLRLTDNSTTVIASIPGHSAGQRAVNPVSVSLGVFASGSDTPEATFDVSLKRGQNISFIADDKGIHLIENRFATVAK